MIFRKFRSINPYNNQLLKEFNFISEQEILQKLEQSKQGYELNKKRTFIERRRIFEKLDNIINEKKKELSQLICLETGKNIEQCEEEIKDGSQYLKNIIGNMERWLQQERVKTEYKKSMIEYKGIGCVFQIQSNQYPFLLGIRNAVDALSGGNSVLMRCGDSCGLSGLALEEIMKESGLQGHEFQLLFTDPQHSSLIITHSAVQALSFTGTNKNARPIASLSANHFKRQILFCETNNPFIVWHDANLTQTIQSLLKYKFIFNGQSCHSPKRIIIHNHILPDFIHQLLISFSKLISGNPLNPQSQITVMSRLDLALKLESQIKQAVQQGDKILIGGNRQNCFFEPTIIIVNKDSILMKEEVLGPVLVICPAEENEILEIANNNYGFNQNASFFSQNEKNVEKLKELENMSLFINQCPSINEFKMPISSFKNSGMGIQGSKYSVYQYCNINSVQFNN